MLVYQLANCFAPHGRWALGVLVYELCNGLPPFLDEDRLVMFRKVCSRDFKMPQHFSQVRK